MYFATNAIRKRRTSYCYA